MKISRSLTAETNTKSGAVTLRFVDEEGNDQKIDIPGQAADLLLVGLLSSPPDRRQDGKTSPQRAPLCITGSSGKKYENGLLGLSLTTQEGLHVNIAFPAEAVKALQAQLQRLLSEEPPAVH